MRILTRYVLGEMTKLFVLTLTGLTLVIFIGLVGKQAVDKGIGLGPLLRMTPYLLPQAMQFAVPGTMLLATTSIYGRMSSYNEITAIKSLGISPMTLIWPTLIMATFVSFAGVVLNDLAVSWGQSGVDRVFLESIEDVAYGQLRVNRTFTFGKLTINVRRVDGHRLIQPVMIQQSPEGGKSKLVMADEAELFANPADRTLLAKLHNVEVDASVKAVYPDWFPMQYSLDDILGSTRSKSPSNYALAEVKPAIKDEQEHLDQVRESTTADASFAMLTGDFDSLSDTWKKHDKERVTSQQRLQRLYTEPWRRWANGFSCLCFVLIGAPMAIRLRHAEFLASFFACFLPILLVYYPLMAVSVDRAKDGDMPPPAVWLGNIVLGLWGVWLMRRVVRY